MREALRTPGPTNRCLLEVSVNNYRNLTALICFVGCGQEKDGIGSDDGNIPMTVNCHDEGECTPILQIAAGGIDLCFEPDCIAYPVDCWPPGTPQLVIDNCEPGSQFACVIEPPYQANLAVDNTTDGCVCTGRDIFDLGDPVSAAREEACCIDADAIYRDVFSEVTEALDNCGFSYGIDKGTCDPDEAATWQVCNPINVVPISPNAELLLYVDSGLSYISMDTPTGNDTVSVGGGGSARTGPDKFLTAWVSAEDATLGSQNFTEWLWWMDGHMDIDVSAGTISVPADDEIPFLGEGKQNSVRKQASIYMDEDASGTIDPLTHTWTLDFLQDSYGWEVEIHLEGSYEDVP